MGDAPAPKIYDQKHYAAQYEDSTGGCTRDLARHILSLCPPITSGSVIHDNACGPGIVAQEIVGLHILTQSPPDPAYDLKIHCTDRSEAMIELTKTGYGECESANAMLSSFPHVAVDFQVAPAETLPFPDASFSHSFTNCGILHFEDGLGGAREILRTLKPGGAAVVTSWRVVRAFEVVREAQRACGHAEPLFRPPIDEKWFQPATLEGVLKNAGFVDVQMGEKTVHVAGKDVKEVCNHILTLLSRYSQQWSGDELAKFKEQLEVQAEKAVVPIQRPRPEGGVDDLVGIPMVAITAVAKKGQ